ncbi:MAG: hypothetical protein JJU19_09040 [Pararhodobacter sp.]|nr:hypothetical protein [Pararhodobacter sp.]
MKIEGQTAIVAGATSDPGRAVVQALAERGACVGAIGPRGTALGGMAGCGTSGAGVAAMSLSLARKLGHDGMRGVAAAPGSFKAGICGPVPAHSQAQLICDVPFAHRYGQPEEFAQLAVEDIGKKMLNSAELRMDGAVRMREPVAMA